MDSMYTRTEMLIGEKATEKLKNSHVAVFGLGGVGSYAVEALARSGIGRLTLIDNDEVAVSNINRQLYALVSTVGQAKTEAAKNRIADINPNCTVKTIKEFCLPENIDIFFEDNYDFVVDAIDTVSAKLAIAQRCDSRGIHLISSMGTGNKLHPELFRISDIYKTEVCPLCRVMRRELKDRGINKLNVVWSPEQPHRDAESGRTPASIAFVPSCAGLLMASYVIQSLISESD